MTLPPLPDPDYWSTRDDDTPLFTAAQMESYARAAIAAHVPEAAFGNIAAVPAHPVIRTLSPEQIERHTFKASECPPDSVVMLVSSINRLLSKRPGEGIRLSQPVAWLCSLMMEDGTTRTQIVEQDPAGLRWNDDGEPSPYKVQPLYAAPQAVPVPAWQPIETAPRGSGEDGPEMVNDPDYVAPPQLLLMTPDGMTVGAYDWYYHAGYGRGAEPGVPAWRQSLSSEPIYDATHWMPLPAAPKEQP